MHAKLVCETGCTPSPPPPAPRLRLRVYRCSSGKNEICGTQNWCHFCDTTFWVWDPPSSLLRHPCPHALWPEGQQGCCQLLKTFARGCHKDAPPPPFLWHPLSEIWWLPTNRHRLHTNRHQLPTNRHRLHTNRHQLPTNRHRLSTGRHRGAYWTLRVFFFFFHCGTP